MAKKQNRRKADKKWTEAEAKQVLQKQAQSGQTVTQYAKAHGITESRLYRWKALLSTKNGKPAGECRPKKKAAKTASQKLQIAPVVLTGQRAQSTAAIVRVGEFEIEVIEPDKVTGVWLQQVATAALEAIG